jgi:hypothetical protein
MTTYQGHIVTVEKAGQGWRWTCRTCREKGDILKKKRRALDGASYHEYAKRPMTADEIRTGGDGMNADLTPAQARERADAFNDRLRRETA